MAWFLLDPLVPECSYTTGATEDDVLKAAFRADAFPPAARVVAWEKRLRGFAIDSSGAAGSDAFQGNVESYQSQRGSVFSILESGPQTLSHEAGRCDEVFWLSQVLDGRSWIDIDGVAAELRPGDIIYGKRGAPGKLRIHTDFRMMMANMPASLITQGVFLPLPNRVIVIRAESGTNIVLGRMLSALVDCIECLNDARIYAIEGALIQLLVGSIFDNVREAKLGGAATGRASLLRRIWQTIELQLPDPMLNIAGIAAAHKLSVRYIQLLFKDSNQSFRRYVQQRRLESIRQDLVNPLNRNVPITIICLYWGFADSSSFSRAFKAAFGISPSQYRRNGLSAAASKPRQPLLGLSFQPA